jgi:Domain of unknown function (DUF4160)
LPIFVVELDNIFVPTVKIIDGIKIDLYSRDHPPPHFHALYAGYEELIVIETLETYAGRLPKNQRKKVVEWANERREWLLTIFNQLNKRNETDRKNTKDNKG